MTTSRARCTATRPPRSRPTLLALAETGGASGAALLDALVAGVEVESAIGEMTGGGHYNLGFHATGTIGAFGAAAGAARLLRLDAEAAGRALGLAATQAAGLKCNFGTMAKPFHAGTAAAAGLLAARLAARGFTASDEAIEGPQGFLATQCPDSAPLPFRPDPSAPFWIERTLFKYHAACYSTHGTIEAVRALRARHGIGLSDMEAMTLHVHPRHLKVCNIAEPRTGLEMKFSLRQLAVAALDGRDTAALETFSDATATDPRYVTARRRVAVETDPDRDRLTTRVEIRLMDGRHLAEDTDVGQPATDLPAQWDRLAAKFASLATPVIGAAQAVRAVAAVAALDRATDISGLIVALR